MTFFRTARPEDSQPLADFVNSAFRGDGSKRGWTTEADFLDGQRTDAEMILEMISGPESRVELALADEGGLVGCVFLKRETPQSCYLGMLTVNPGKQSAGLGTIILEHSEKLARRWGCVRMRMTVIHLREELIRYYERRGYRRTGATEPFPENDPRFGLPKVAGLKFLELVKTFDP